MTKRFRHASLFLHGNGTIAALLTGIERNLDLLREVRRSLPRDLAAHCLHASIEGSVLVLLTDSPVWGSRLRFFAPDVLRSLPGGRARATRCRVRIQPASAAPAQNPSASAKPRLSESTVKHLREAADSAKDEGIATALRRLAEHGGGRDQADATKGRT